MTRHPLSRDMTRVREAQGALGALLMAEGDERTSEADRAALARLWAALRWAIDQEDWEGPDIRMKLGRLRHALTDDSPQDDVLRA